MEARKTNSESKKVTILIEIHAKEGQEDFARETFTQTIATAHKPGMISAIVYEDILNAGTFYSVQEWESIEDFKSHMQEAKASPSAFADKTSMLRDIPKTSVLKRID